jgi:hypothetical protein
MSGMRKPTSEKSKPTGALFEMLAASGELDAVLSGRGLEFTPAVAAPWLQLRGKHGALGGIGGS